MEVHLSQSANIKMGAKRTAPQYRLYKRPQDLSRGGEGVDELQSR